MRSRPLFRPLSILSARFTPWFAVALALGSGACAPTLQRADAVVVDQAAHAGGEPAAAAPASVGHGLLGAESYDPAVSPPSVLLGITVGQRLAHPHEILGCFQRWAEQSPRVRLATYATTYEGRPLIRAVITSEKNLARLDEIKANLARLADPRGLSDADAQRLIEATPPVAWLGYSIHGDEVSGADASMLVGYELAAGRGAAVERLLEQVVVVIDPVMNPDGRARIVSQIEQANGAVSNIDYASMHRGWWPWGRGNHYLFDMNRDWIAGVAPETRGRWAAHLEFHPQLVVDAHEMGAQDTYLFYPLADPKNTNIPESVFKWQERFAAAHADAFDQRGWLYYTREWADGWYPGYTDAWASLNGGVGMLYEQASAKGLPLRRPAGDVIAYADTVLAQAVSSVSDLSTLAQNRVEVLRDYYRGRKESLTGKRAYLMVPGRAVDREREFLATLMRQGIEVYEASDAFRASGAEASLGAGRTRARFPKGTYVIPDGQPQGRLVRAILEFDPRVPEKTVLEERRELEQKGESKLYDVTAWDLGRAFDLDVYWADPPSATLVQLAALPEVQTGIAKAEGAKPTVAWLVPGNLDASVSFAVRAVELGLKVRVAEKPFTTSGRAYPRGTLLVHRQDNGDAVESLVEAAAAQAGVLVQRTQTGRSPDDGPDLGARHFTLLDRPRVAVVANSPVSPSDYGHVWQHLDRVIGVPFSILDAQAFGGYDLRRYNVIIVPPAWGSLAGVLGRDGSRLADWVRAGGTLITIGGSSKAVATPESKLVSVRRRSDVLEDLDAYREAAVREIALRKGVTVDTAALWGDRRSRPAADASGEPPPIEPSPPAEAESRGPGSTSGSSGGGGKAAVARLDEWQRRFAPSGALLRGLIDPEAWIGFGCTSEIPVMYGSSSVFMAKEPAAVPVRLAPREQLRLGGLLWPEAAERLEYGVYVAVESVGDGQVVMFADSPVFRGFFRGTGRLLSNAVVYGPSLGAHQPSQW